MQELIECYHIARKNIENALIDKASINTYDFPSDSIPMMKFLEKVDRYVGINPEYGAIDSNGNYTRLNSLDSDVLLDMLEHSEKLIEPFPVESFQLQKDYLYSDLEFAVQNKHTVVTKEEFGEEVCGSHVIQLRNEKGAVSTFIMSGNVKRGYVYTCIYKS